MPELFRMDCRRLARGCSGLFLKWLVCWAFGAMMIFAAPRLAKNTERRTQTGRRVFFAAPP